MIPLRFIREHQDLVRQGLAARGGNAPLEETLRLDDRRRALLQEVERVRADRNSRSRQIGGVSDAVRRAELIEATRALSKQIDALSPELASIEDEIDQLLLLFPAQPHASVPRGEGPADNPVLRERGARPEFDFEPVQHVELGEALAILDFPRAANVAGSGFATYRGGGARLRRALVTWMLDFHIAQHDYREVHPPAMVTAESMTDSGKLPKFADDSYHIDPDGLWMSPTAEVALAAQHRDEVLDGSMLPLKYVAYTPAFRREAGAAGVETRGLRRRHQFDKVELFNFSDPTRSYDDMHAMLAAAEATAAALDLPFRVVEMCSAELGFSAAKQYDLEVWAAGVGDWLEISSVSNCETFQSRRSGTRFRAPGENRTQYVHTLNGTALGVQRTMIAILENNQRADGTVTIPDVLLPYVGGQARLEPETGWP